LPRRPMSSRRIRALGGVMSPGRSRWRGSGRGSSPSGPPAPGRRATWPPSRSPPWPGSSCRTCPIAVPARR
jgi:hypothetical protein